MRDQRSRGVYIIPNLLTTGNLFSGFYAIVSVLNGEFLGAAIAILVGMVFDTLDGRWARLTRTTSRFGMEYDSLADVVTFGIAPGVLIYSWALSGYGRLGWVAAFLYVACGALRLARFNVDVGTVESHNFKGLPIPASAGLIASLVLMDYRFLRMGTEVKPLLIVGLIYVLAFLMVSTFRYSSFKDMKLLKKKPFPMLVTAVLFFIVLAAEPNIMLFVFFAGYAASGILERPGRWVYNKVVNPSHPSQEKKESGTPT
jgi:CDP-diacylglycerol--serine O-phosphatidyltransferase